MNKIFFPVVLLSASIAWAPLIEIPFGFNGACDSVTSYIRTSLGKYEPYFEDLFVSFESEVYKNTPRINLSIKFKKQSQGEKRSFGICIPINVIWYMSDLLRKNVAALTSDQARFKRKFDAILQSILAHYKYCDDQGEVDQKIVKERIFKADKRAVKKGFEQGMLEFLYDEKEWLEEVQKAEVFCTMKFYVDSVKGKSFDQFIAEKHPPIEERIERVKAFAVEYANKEKEETTSSAILVD